MECNKWDESGLLYMANELSQPLTSEFEQHLKICQCCSNELNQYFLERKKYFSAAFLCEPTPEHLDKKIISLCAKPMIPTGIGIFYLPWVKRVLFSALVFALGVGAGGYFTFAYYQSKSSSAYAQSKVTAPSKTVNATATAALDTAKKSLPQKGEKVLPVKPPQGIVPVDLKKE
ncbi:MAG TPA: hypothetical protein VLX68_16310 [Chitinivibrionales bacterium]|nr:hypothetical protein [Chitinivibrionales bacterium]